MNQVVSGVKKQNLDLSSKSTKVNQMCGQFQHDLVILWLYLTINTTVFMPIVILSSPSMVLCSIAQLEIKVTG